MSSFGGGSAFFVRPIQREAPGNTFSDLFHRLAHQWDGSRPLVNVVGVYPVAVQEQPSVSVFDRIHDQRHATGEPQPSGRVVRPLHARQRLDLWTAIW